MANILLVDDDDGLLEIGKEFLESGGDHVVITVNSPKNAINLIGCAPIDVVVSDYQMPEVDGIHFLEMVRARDKSIPFILFTGKGREEVVIEAINRGADSYIKKDTDIRSQYAQLLHTIDQAIMRREAEDAVDYNLRLFKQLMENTADLVIVVDKDGYVEYVSPSVKMILGYSEEELVGRQGYDFLPQDLKQHVSQCNIGNPASFYNEWINVEVKKKDGTWAILEVVAKLFERGGKTKTIIDARDVTEKVEKDRQLKRQLDEIAGLHELIHRGQQGKAFGSVRYDYPKHELTLSPTAKRILGLEDHNGEIDTVLIKDLVHPEDKWVLSDLTRHSTLLNEPLEIVYRIVLYNGETRMINSVSSMINAENGEPLFLVGQICDVTSMMKLHETLRNMKETSK